MKITQIRSQWHEPQNFSILRYDTGEEYIFIHFLTPVQLLDGDQWIPVEAGSCILYGKHAHQHFRSPDCDLNHDWFHATGDLSPLLERYGLVCNRVYRPATSGFITELVRSMEFETVGQRLFADEICTCRIEELLARISRSCREAENPISDTSTVRQIREFRVRLNATFREDWSVERMASELNLSVSRFHCLYRSLFGVSPKQDLHQMRVAHAKELLQYSTEPISEIAAQLGYSNANLFIRQFHARMGTSPGQFRAQVLQAHERKGEFK